MVFVEVGVDAAELLPLRALSASAGASVILHDASLSEAILDLLNQGAGPGCTRTEMAAGGPEARASSASALLRTLAREGRAPKVVRVVRLPAMLASASDEVAAMVRAGATVEVIPGLSPASVLPALAGLPLVSHEDLSPSVTVLRVGDDLLHLHDWAKLSAATDALVVDVAATNVGDVVAAILAEGRSPATPAAVVTGLGTSAQDVLVGVLSDVATRARGLSVAQRLLLVVGDALRLHRSLAWFGERPLHGKRVAVVRPREQGDGAASLLRGAGAQVLLVPSILVTPPDDGGEGLRKALDGLRTSYDWVVFTSANAVSWTFREVSRRGADGRLFGNVQIACIGAATALALREWGLAADLVAEEAVGEALARALLAAHRDEVGPPRRGLHPRVLLPRARDAREVLPDALRAAGWHVDVVTAYVTRPAPPEDLAPLRRALEKSEVDVVLFTSSSTADHLVAGLDVPKPGAGKDLLSTVCRAAIGPITAATLTRHGLAPQVVAEEHTLQGLVRALEGHFGYAGELRRP